ncbi:MAG: hypothetical protein K0B15_11110 [Lentimicrobium sp.]|nr:hypothetical protein [Lentimicrobium sp.]
MKTRFFLSAMLLFVFGFSTYIKAENEASQKLTVAATPGFEALLSGWEAAYNSSNPESPVITAEQSKAGLWVTGSEYLSQNPELNKKSVIVGRNVIVPVFNSNHPYADLINQQGVTPSSLSNLFQSGEIMNWSVLTGNKTAGKIKLVVMNDPSMLRQIEIFLKCKIDMDRVTVCATESDFRTLISSDVLALGFVNLPVVLNENEAAFAKNFSILPIDRDENGRIDPMENFYQDAETFTRSVWIGKYPQTLINSISIASASASLSPDQAAFINWVLSQGQNQLVINGFTELSGPERQANLSKLSQPLIITEVTDTFSAKLIMLLMIIGGIAIIGLLVTWLFSTGIKDAKPLANRQVSGVFNEGSLAIPKGLLFDKTHTWAIMEANGSIKVGLDDFIQQLTGIGTKISAMELGEKVTKGDRLITILSEGKQMSLRSPISGIIKAKNPDVEQGITPGSLVENWIYKIEPANWKRDSQFMFRADQYKEWLKGEFTRLRDFLASTMNAHAPQYAHITLQDGGELKEGLLTELGPEVWEDFQNGFLDSVR